MDNKNLVNGSMALAPKHKPQTPNVDEEFERLRKARLEREKVQAQKRVKAKLQIMKGILFTFAIGIVLVLRYSAVYNLQKGLTTVNSQIHNYSMDNENLKVQILKVSNMQQVEETAKTKLHMVTPDKNSIIYNEATKDYFAKSTNDNKKNTQENLLAKLKNMLF